jgi:hypothetical protein
MILFVPYIPPVFLNYVSVFIIQPDTISWPCYMPRLFLGVTITDSASANYNILKSKMG